MQKPESVFIASIHRLLPPTLHREKMHNPYSGGTADVWYSGYKADLWVEYKFLQRIPVRAETLIAPNCSPLQLIWLSDRLSEGRSVAVVLGCTLGGVILQNRTWNSPFTTAQFRRQILPRTTLAEWIVRETCR